MAVYYDCFGDYDAVRSAYGPDTPPEARPGSGPWCGRGRRRAPTPRT